MTRKVPHSAYDAAFTDGQAETAVAIPATASFADVTCDGANVWLGINTSSGSMSLATNPETKAVLINKDWTVPVCIELPHAMQRKSDFTHFKFKPVAGAAGQLTINFYK